MYRCRQTVGHIDDKDEKVSGSGKSKIWIINWISSVCIREKLKVME